MRPPAVCFVARSGTGKTTLLEKVIPELVRRGHRVGAVKHHSHDFDIDRPGKDSHRLAEAGSAVTVISSPDRLALVRRGSEPCLEEILGRYFGEVDLVLVEGYKGEAIPKIEIHRAAVGGPLLTRGEIADPALAAVVSDEPLDLDVPLLDLENVAALADFIEERIMGLFRAGGPRGPVE